MLKLYKSNFKLNYTFKFLYDVRQYTINHI